MSTIEDKVCEKIQGRAEVGLKKYGVSMADEVLSLREWLIHLQEELMDAAVYVEKLIEEVDNEMQIKKLLTDIDSQKHNQDLTDRWNEKERYSPEWKKNFRQIKGAISYHQRWMGEEE